MSLPWASIPCHSSTCLTSSEQKVPPDIQFPCDGDSELPVTPIHLAPTPPIPQRPWEAGGPTVVIATGHQQFVPSWIPWFQTIPLTIKAALSSAVCEWEACSLNANALPVPSAPQPSHGHSISRVASEVMLFSQDWG